MRWVICLAALAFLPTVASATPVAVANADFEAPGVLTQGGSKGLWDYGAAGWTANGVAGTWEYDDSLFVAGFGDVAGDRIGFVNAGGALSQSLGVTIEEGASYSLSALFANRVGLGDYSGSIGFFAGGDPLNLIGALQSIALIGEGLFATQTFDLGAALLKDYVGLELGIIVISSSGQVNFDNLTVDSDKMLVNPIPAAAWLFGTALLGGGFAVRRKKNPVPQE